MKNAMRRGVRRWLSAALGALLSCACETGAAGPPPAVRAPVRWLGLHAVLFDERNAAALARQIPDLAEAGVNLVIAQIDYNYQFERHPELSRPGAIPRPAIRVLVNVCRAHGIRLIPEFETLGHQSWAGETYPLLAKHPQFDETPGAHPRNAGIYCRSWCPSNPGVNAIVFDLYDELLDAFEADALHVGMDEVFLIASDLCPRCRGKDPAALFARAVREAHAHIVGKRGREMFMWGDRLLDSGRTGYGEWEASAGRTAAAVDLIPKDIVVCDWHYETNPEKAYPSIDFFLRKGFRVLPASHRNPAAVADLIDYSLRFKDDSLLGHLCTTWGSAKAASTRLKEYAPLQIAAGRLVVASPPPPPAREP